MSGVSAGDGGERGGKAPGGRPPTRPDAPPALPRRLLGRTLPPGPVGASILGDLTETWSHRPPGAARNLWYWREALRLAARYGALRVVSGVLSLVADFRHGLSRAFRNPLHTTVTVSALAVGIAAPATMFTIAAGLVRDLDVEDPDALVHVGRRTASRHIQAATVEWLRPLLVSADGLESVGVFGSDAVDLSGEGGPPERRRMGVVTPEVFHVLGRGAVVGRTLAPGDAASGTPVAVLGWDLWRSRFGGDRTALGSTIRVDGVPHTVVGVMPERFTFPDDAALWTALDPEAPPVPDAAAYRLVGRLEEGATLERVGARVDAATGALREAGHEIGPARGLAVEPFRYRHMDPEDRRLVATMVVVVSFVLLIACANVVNLLLARSLDRSRETAVRIALGAGRGRVVGAHLAEAAAMAVLGGVLGLTLAAGVVGAFERRAAPFLGHWMDFRLDPATAAFCAGLVLLAALLTGLLPALRAGKVDVAPLLRDGGRGASGARVGRIGRVLVVGQVALSCALLVAAGLMTRGAVERTVADGEFETASILTARYELRPDAYPDEADVVAFQRRVLETLERLPEVEAVAFTTHLPGIAGSRRPVEIEGRTYERPEDRPRTVVPTVSPGFFRILDGEVGRGRPFTWSDGSDGAPAVVVNEAFARANFPGEDPLGRRLRIVPFSDPEGEPEWATVVGVAPPLGVLGGLAGRDASAVYLPFTADPGRYTALLVRARPGTDPLSLLAEVRSSVGVLEPDLALYDVDTLEGRIAESRRGETLFAWLFLAFGLAGLTLAGVGLYGLLSFTVRRRVRELGVRIAVGARPGHVLWTAMRGGALQLGVGLAAGLGLAWLLAPSLGAALMGTDPRDPLVYGTVAGTLAAVGLLAALRPARRALGVDVVETLRTE